MPGMDSQRCFILGDFMESSRHFGEIRAAVVTISDRDALLSIIREIARAHTTHIICFDAEKLAGRRHAELALRYAARSFFSGEPISNSFEMEALLYAAGTRQCALASAFGIHDEENQLYICCCPASDGALEVLARHMHFVDAPWENINAKKTIRLMDLFGITADEIAAAGEDQIVALVCERVALLDVSK
jgi:KEOPS complex subunit Cgi121